MAKSINNQLLGGDFSRADFFYNIQKYLKIGFWYCEGPEYRLFFSKKFLTAVGFAHADNGITLDEFKSVVHDDDRKVLAKVFKQLFNKRKSVSSLEVRIKFNNEWLWIRSSAVVVDITPQNQIMLIVGKFSETHVSKYKSVNSTLDIYMNFASFVYNVGSNVITWNTSAYKLLGIHEEETPFTIRNLKSKLSAEVYEGFISKWESFCSKNEKEFAFNFNITNAKGETNNIAVYANKNDGEDGCIIFGILQNRFNIPNDIKILDNKLLKLKDSLAQLPIPIIVFRNDAGVISVNRQFVKLFGYRAEELIAENGFKQLFVRDSDRIQFSEFLYTSGKSIVLPIKSKSGENRDIQWTIISSDIDGKTIVYGIDLSNLTKEQKSTKKLKQRVDFFTNHMPNFYSCNSLDEVRSLISNTFLYLFPGYIGVSFLYNAVDGFVTINDVIGIPAKRNDELLEVMGWNPIGRRFFISIEKSVLLVPSPPKKIDRSLSQLTDGYLLVSTAKSIEKFFDITEIYSYCNSYSDVMSGGMLILKADTCSEFNPDLANDLQVVSTIAMKKIFAASNCPVQKSSEAVLSKGSQTFNILGSEIITPSNSIIGYAQLLQNQGIDKEQKEQFIDRIISSGRKLLNFANNLSDLSRIEEGKITFVRTQIDAKRVLNNVAVSCRNAMDSNKIERVKILQSFSDESINYEFYCDEGRLEQIFDRLLDSILIYNDKGTILLNFMVQDKTIEFDIESDCSDIDPKMHEILLQKFQNQDDDSIGILLARKLIEVQGGTFEVVKSSSNEITFRILFPLSLNDSNNVPKEIDDHTGVSFNLRNKVILVAEDEEFNYKLLKILLETWGATTIWAKNGKEAVSLVNSMQNSIDMIFMDIRMPEMNGYAATMEIKQIDSKIPIIAQTAYSDIEDKLKAESAGCDDYIAKPIEVNKLSNLLEKYF